MISVCWNSKFIKQFVFFQVEWICYFSLVSVCGSWYWCIVNLCEHKFLFIALSPSYFSHIIFSGHNNIPDSQVCLPAIIVIKLSLEVVESASWMLEFGKWKSSFLQMLRARNIRWRDMLQRNFIIYGQTSGSFQTVIRPYISTSI